jgi:hypothetical protein
MDKPIGAQGLYHLTVAYEEGGMRIRQAWVVCGGWLLGPKTEKVGFRWDGVSQPLPPPEPPSSPPQDDSLWDAWLDT